MSIKDDHQVVVSLDEKQRKRLMQIADMCPAHRTLVGGSEIITEEVVGEN